METSVIVAISGAAGIAITKLFDWVTARDTRRDQGLAAEREALRQERVSLNQQMEALRQEQRADLAAVKLENAALRSELSRLQAELAHSRLLIAELVVIVKEVAPERWAEIRVRLTDEAVPVGDGAVRSE